MFQPGEQVIFIGFRDNKGSLIQKNNPYIHLSSPMVGEPWHNQELQVGTLLTIYSVDSFDKYGVRVAETLGGDTLYFRPSELQSVGISDVSVEQYL